MTHRHRLTAGQTLFLPLHTRKVAGSIPAGTTDETAAQGLYFGLQQNVMYPSDIGTIGAGPKGVRSSPVFSHGQHGQSSHLVARLLTNDLPSATAIFGCRGCRGPRGCRVSQPLTPARFAHSPKDRVRRGRSTPTPNTLQRSFERRSPPG